MPPILTHSPTGFRRGRAVVTAVDNAHYTPPGHCSGCLHAKAHRLPIHGPLIDGRSGWDWHRSILAWLNFRAGTAWRPARHSGGCAASDYRDAARLVTLAFHHSYDPPTHKAATEQLREAA